jgi:hypothetical protein
MARGEEMRQSVCFCLFFNRREHLGGGEVSSWQHVYENRKFVAKSWRQIPKKAKNVANRIFHDWAPLPLTMRHTLSILVIFRTYGAS